MRAILFVLSTLLVTPTFGRDEPPRVILETDAGNVEIEILVESAPISGENFLAYVDGGHFDGTTFYRVVRKEHGGGDPSAIQVVQGGLMGSAMTASDPATAELPEPPFPPIAHETTEKTGISNARGTISYARLAPGTASSEFFFNMKDNPSLDTGDTRRQTDGQGYAAFGRVVAGMDVLEKIQAMPTNEDAPSPVMKGQLLTRQVTIKSARRVGN